jgi:predicted dehydrogenase
MDYTKQPLGFRLRKALRYVRLYGPRRTLVKIRGQYHMGKTFDRLPDRGATRGDGGRHVGIIGCGNFAYSVIAYYLKRNYGPVLRAAMDRTIERAASLYQDYGLSYYTDDAGRIVEDPEIDLVYIASNHASHAEYAISALERGKSVHIEKPHVVNRDQLVRLCRAMQASRGRVNLGFNRPNSRVGRRIKRALDSQSGPSMLNWFVAGHHIDPEHWYFKAEEGGRVLGNLCHWIDFIYRMTDPSARYPIRISPTRGAKSDTDIAVTYLFGDGTIGIITFSAKGHTFEGVRESFSAHRGNVLIAMSDFKQMCIENVAHKERNRALFRDHGHEETIRKSYAMSSKAGASFGGSEVAYVWETAELFLATREALEREQTMELGPFASSRLDR